MADNPVKYDIKRTARKAGFAAAAAAVAALLPYISSAAVAGPLGPAIIALGTAVIAAAADWLKHKSRGEAEA